MAGKKIGFIGAGQMATALATGFLRENVAEQSSLYAYDINANSAKRFLQATGATFCSSIRDTIEVADIILIAVKPQQIEDVCPQIKEVLYGIFKQKLIITIVAGIPISFYEELLGDTIRLVRVMPNTPGLIGEAASGYALSKNAYSEDGTTVNTLLSTIGLAYELPENLLDAVTGLSGSGPAYVFMMIDALADGGVKMGLQRTVALELAAQTLKGSADLYLKTKEHPSSLKDKVTSPAGTTIAGITALENHGFRAALIEAVEAATKRSKELGEH